MHVRRFTKKKKKWLLYKKKNSYSKFEKFFWNKRKYFFVGIQGEATLEIKVSWFIHSLDKSWFRDADRCDTGDNSDHLAAN